MKKALKKARSSALPINYLYMHSIKKSSKKVIQKDYKEQTEYKTHLSAALSFYKIINVSTEI